MARAAGEQAQRAARLAARLDRPRWKWAPGAWLDSSPVLALAATFAAAAAAAAVDSTNCRKRLAGCQASQRLALQIAASRKRCRLSDYRKRLETSLASQAKGLAASSLMSTKLPMSWLDVGAGDAIAASAAASSLASATFAASREGARPDCRRLEDSQRYCCCCCCLFRRRCRCIRARREQLARPQPPRATTSRSSVCNWSRSRSNGRDFAASRLARRAGRRCFGKRLCCLAIGSCQ